MNKPWVYDLTLITKCMAKKCLINIEGHLGLVRSIEMEDGSGKCYNVKMLVGDKTISVFIHASLSGLKCDCV